MRSRDLFVAFLRAVGVSLLCAAVVLGLGVLGSPTADSTLVSVLLLFGTTTLMGVWMLLGATTLTNRLRWPDEAGPEGNVRLATGAMEGEAPAGTGAAASEAPGAPSGQREEGPPAWILRGVEYFMAWAFTLRAVADGADVVARLFAGPDVPPDLAFAFRGPLGSAVASAVLAAVLFVRAARATRRARSAT